MAYQVNFCETKEQLKHLAEVVTGKADGSPTGADIETSTLAYAGLVRDTLPELLSKLGWYSVGEWSTDPLISSDNQYVLYNGIRYAPLSIPYQVDSTANPDPELLVGTELKVITDVTDEDVTEAQNDIVGGSIFKGSNGEYVQNGDTVPTQTPPITHLRVLVGGEPALVAITPIASGLVSNITDSEANIGGVVVEFKNSLASQSPVNIKVSDYSNFREAVEFNSNSGNITVVIDQDTTIDKEFTYVGDITITGSGVIELASGVLIGMNLIGGSARSHVNVEFTTQDKTSTTNITAIKATDFQDVKISSVINRVCIRALNDISNVKGNVYFNGLIKGDYSSIPEGINDAVVLVEAANLFDVSNCVNESVGCERLFKSSHSVRTFRGINGEYRGSTKRQVIDTYINTKKVIFRGNDVKMDSFLTLVEGKLKTEPDLPGVIPEQVLVDVSDNVIEIPDDACNRIVLFQAPGGSSAEPSDYEYESSIKFNENIVNGRTLSSIIDARGFTNYEEKGGTYKNGELDRQTANIVACENIEIEDINADSYAAYISGTGSSQGGIPYNRSPKRVELSNLGKTYKFNGFVFIDDCSSLSKLVVNKSNAKERLTSEPGTGFVLLRDSSVDLLEMTHNKLERNTSIPLRLDNSTITKKTISNNDWQIDSGDFAEAVIQDGASFEITTNIDGGIVPSTSRFSADVSENLQGCTISAYKEGADVKISIFNNTGASKTISAGKYYIECLEN